MALSDRRILEAMKRGDIVITPFKRENLGTSSYDVTLGKYYFRENPSKYHLPVYNVWSKSHTDHVWGKKPHVAERAKNLFRMLNIPWDGISPNDRVILLEPGETVLAHTNEFIGGKNRVTTMMKARSSMGRNFIEVCKCAGWGDVGYVNRWTMEITNNSAHYTIPLIVGCRIGQMVFFDTGPILGADYTKSGKYGKTSDIAVLKKKWKPQMMLPRLYDDRDIKRKKSRS